MIIFIVWKGGAVLELTKLHENFFIITFARVVWSGCLRHQQNQGQIWHVSGPKHFGPWTKFGPFGPNDCPWSYWPCFGPHWSKLVHGKFQMGQVTFKILPWSCRYLKLPNLTTLASYWKKRFSHLIWWTQELKLSL